MKDEDESLGARDKADMGLARDDGDPTSDSGGDSNDSTRWRGVLDGDEDEEAPWAAMTSMISSG